MIKLDIKDRKILYELDLNCRQSNAQIGKKVGLGRDVVGYRIKKLEEDGIIKNYFTVIDTFKLGYNVFRLYINFHYVDQNKKMEIIQYFIDYKNSWVVASEKSEIDLDAVIWVKDIFDFYQFWEKTLDKYEDYFSKYSISIYIQAIVYDKAFLFNNLDTNKNREICKMSCGGKSVEIDEIDNNLLTELAENARIQLIDLADKLECSSQNVNYRIKNLIKFGLIKAFRVDIDLSKLGLKRFKIDIYLKDHKLKKPITDYLQNKLYLEFMNFAIGWADLEPEFVVEKFDDLYKILADIESKFPNSIKKQSFFITEKIYKLRCMPYFDK